MAELGHPGVGAVIWLVSRDEPCSPPGRNQCKNRSSIPPQMPADGGLGWHSKRLGSGGKKFNV